MKDDMAEEATNLKKILNQEFGLFKKDSLVLQKQQEQKEKFIIEWEDDSASEEETNNIPKRK